ncbi:metallophosphoesterase [Desertivirga xinjiangensis]|uniref:metallophosphoesterase n=1 Tax=Desertivirga xinjiangensis TaxID=539206 RepID=UPI002109FB39|nr:metallophosphoesterase [Pedobacter xinjiangensis]
MSDRIIPLLIISAFLLLIDLYIFKALKTLDKKPASRQSNTFAWLWWGYSALLLIGVFASVFFSLFLTLRAVILVAFVLTFVTKIAYLPFLFADDLRRGIKKLLRKSKTQSAPESGTAVKIPSGSDDQISQPLEDKVSAGAEDKISRSNFLLKAGLVVASIPFASLTWGITSGAYDYKVVRKKLFLKNLPKAFDGIRLAQLSDIHSGSFYNHRAVLGGIEQLLAEKPDFVFFTGDLVNNVASEMRDYQNIFSKVKAPLGVYSSLGNHDYGDYYFGKKPSLKKAKNLQDLKQTHKNMGWDLLLNDNRRLKVDGEEIGILGVENWGAGERFPKFGRLDLAVQGTDDLPVKLLLSHDPSHWRNHVLQYPDINATFSGHTHGMQFGVRTEEYQWSPVQYIYKEWAGLYQENDQQLYVNVGYGFLGYPGRVGILPEITIFELKPT